MLACVLEQTCLRSDHDPSSSTIKQVKLGFKKNNQIQNLYESKTNPTHPNPKH